MSWPKMTLDKIADFSLGKMLDEKKNRGELRPYLANVNVRWGSFELDSLREMRFEEKESKRYGLNNGDIIMCEGGEPGRCAIWKGQVPNMMYQKALHRIRPHSDVDGKFVYYSFLKLGNAGGFSSLITGATIKHLPKEKLARIELQMPPLPTQRRIASILSAYDDLIENNLKRIKLLEEIAQRRYEEWFVKFRVGGKQLEVDRGTGLPKGWERKKLVEVAILTMGQSPKSEFYNKQRSGLPFHQGVSDYGFRFPENSTWSNEGSRFAEKGDILFSVRAPVGRLNVAIEKIILGRGLASIRSKTDWTSMLFYQLQNIFFKDDLMGGGAIFNSVTKADVERIEVIVPVKPIGDKFNSLVSSIDQQIEVLTLQNRLLKESRDILLPRLMSGKIEV